MWNFNRRLVFLYLFATWGHLSHAAEPEVLPTEKLDGDSVWKMSTLENVRGNRPIRVTVWYRDQFLGDGAAYKRRAGEFKDSKRRELRASTVKTLKSLSNKSHAAAEESLNELVEAKTVSALERHWIVNGFSCNILPAGIADLEAVPGVAKIFRVRAGGPQRRAPARPIKPVPESARQDFQADRYLHPWYTRALLADRVWTEFGVTGTGTLNVIHDFNFALTPAYTHNLYHNPNETPGNGKDDDGNGLIDDSHGYNFQLNSPLLAVANVGLNSASPQLLHGSMCASIICGAGSEDLDHEFGLAPDGRWAAVIGAQRLEAAVEWAVEQEADTYSMSFSMPGLGDYRSHWRKVMEHGSFCGIYFVSGAGNFAQSARVPIQMRTPEDIPEVVFAAAGVQRNLSRTPFSSKGPVLWKTEHYQDGRVQKPEVCAFNMGLPLLLPNGNAVPTGLNGNSFAGPMFCGSIALMVSADPDILPWDLKQIITTTATDIAAEGVDDETGHGLINCYRAVGEVLRRKAIRDGSPAKVVETKEGNQLDIAKQKKLSLRFTVLAVQPNSLAAKKGVQAGDIIQSCADRPIANMQQFRAAKAKATNAGAEKITIVFLRDKKPMPIDFAPGAWGMSAAPAFDEPVFQK